MKAAAQDQWKLLDLAQTDRRIAQAEHRRRTLPELAELKDLAVQRRTLAEEVVAKSTALSDAKMEQKRIEATSNRLAPEWSAIRKPWMRAPSPTIKRCVA